MRETIGHDQAWKRLADAFARDQVHHAYLLAGPESSGKTTLALDFAKLLLCERPVGRPPEPCGECGACRRIAHGNHPDVTLVELEEGKRTLGVDALRETVVRMANLAPTSGDWRVFVMPEVERMTANTVNALLKTLEEPPPGVVILLTTAEPATLLPTLLSRCQLLSLQPLTSDTIETALQTRWQAPAEAAQELATLANGRLGWAIRALAQPELQEKRAALMQRLRGLPYASRDERLRIAGDLAPDVETARANVRVWTQWWRDVTLAAHGGRHLAATGDTGAEALRQAQALGADRAEAFLRRLLEGQAALDQNANPRLTMDVLLLDLPFLQRASAARR